MVDRLVAAVGPPEGPLVKRFKDMGDGSFAEVVSTSAGALALAWTDGTLVAASGSVASGWLDVVGANVLRIGRTHAGGAYAFEIDWSRDGVTVDFTEAVTVANNTTVEKPVAMPFARLRVRNTDAVAAFTAHRTTVYRR